MFEFVRWCFRDFVSGFVTLIVLLMIYFLLADAIAAGYRVMLAVAELKYRGKKDDPTRDHGKKI